MINTKSLIEMARKWQKMATIGPRRISFMRSDMGLNSSIANKGHFVVYTTDKRHFVVPLDYLRSNIFMELLRMSEEEFGYRTMDPSNCFVIPRAVSLVRGCISEDVEKALLASWATCHYSALSSLALGQSHQPTLIHGFCEIKITKTLSDLMLYKIHTVLK